MLEIDRVSHINIVVTTVVRRVYHMCISITNKARCDPKRRCLIILTNGLFLLIYNDVLVQ